MRIIKRFWREIAAVAVIVIGLGTIVGITIVGAGDQDPAPTVQPIAVVSPAKAAVKKPATIPSSTTTTKSETITYIVTGSPAQISYGTDASESATTPLHKTETIKGSYFSIIVKMDDGGTKTKVVVKVNGVTVAKTFTTPENPLASVAVTKEYGSSKWMAVPSTS